MKKFTLLQKLRNKIRIQGNVNIQLAKNIKIANCDISIRGANNSLVIAEGVTIRHTQIEILGDECTIRIGKNSIVGHGCYLSAKEGKKLIIEDACMLSRNVKLMTSDGHFIYIGTKIINKGKDIMIGRHVWLADNVTVLKGVEIGEGSVIGINSTVTKNVPSSCIAVGNPAVVVKNGITNWAD